MTSTPNQQRLADSVRRPAGGIPSHLTRIQTLRYVRDMILPTPFPGPVSPLQLSRRVLLQAGGVGLFGMSRFTGQAFAQPTSPGIAGRDSKGFGRAKRLIFMFMWGGPSHIDTFDMKPNAPAEIRGEFRPIATSASGIQICEHFQHLAPLMDRVAIIRSLTHDDPAHLSSAHTILTGHLPPVNKSDDVPPSDRDTPHIGAVLARLKSAPQGLPPFVTLPWIVSHPGAPGGKAPGQHGGWLGRSYDSFLVDGDLAHPAWRIPALTLSDGIPLTRLEHRESLLREISRQQQGLEGAAASRLDFDQSKAIGLLSSREVRAAFDLSAETDATRDRYGRTMHGQAVLLARRLIERDVPVVSVNWHNDGQNFWDTHGNNFPRLKDTLIPQADKALSALLTDLTERGLLDDTIIAWVGEFGRKPNINKSAGREHHPFCYSGLLMGGGVRGGQIYGASDSTGAYPSDSPVNPRDFSATLMFALGIGPEEALPDRTGRPHALYGGLPIQAVFA